MRYYEHKAKTQKIINAVPMHFAFGNDQFAKKLEELNCTVDDLIGLPAGGFMLKSEAHLFKEAVDKCEKLNAEFMGTDEGMLDALEFELANHEYCITHDEDDALMALGLSKSDERVARLLPQAIDSYLSAVC